MEENLKEKNLEDAIESSLTSCGGYTKGDAKAFNRNNALDEQTLLSFIKTTQPNAWKRYQTTYPVNPEANFIENVCKEIKRVGLLKAFRQGFKDRGIAFKLCYFKPETTINKDAFALYEQNILHATRQLHYSKTSENSIDVVLFLNGIPVVSMELKNQFTGQDVGNAIDQYKFDRAGKDAIFDFKERVLVHFAVDLYNVFMTTRLQGAKTFFLPFNQGSNGAGNVGGKGNPINQNGFATSYLWEHVLTKDMLLEIIQKYLHLEVIKEPKTNKIIKETMIFPRYHQLDVVCKLLADVKANGAGKSYLIQHSAGSGKSNSIAWLSHQLSGLHNDDNQKIFNSVIVLTDRKVLDSQLQDTIYQFDHVAGVVVPIDKNAKQLLEEVNKGTPIIISTLQKFPLIYKDIIAENKNFAVIVDEAHSSQSGKSATTVVSGLGDLEDALKEYAEIEGKQEATEIDDQDLLVKTLVEQGKHKNLTFFAFTATPKSKTLNRFGEKQSDGSYKAFHIYSMKQAIDEGFILDVLANYTTYKTYYKLAKQIAEDPELDSSKGAKAVTRWQTLHPYNIAQKTVIMVEHFNEITKNKIGGLAKAMVVTPSRLHAVRYLFEFKKYIKENNYKNIDVLVAFSGDLDDNGIMWSEEKINKTKSGETIKESQLKEQFHSQDFNILIVAEKYQTGFDEPLLHTMFVDKKLNDVKAVQTLSRLNRTTRGKTDTFVLDFVNETEDIKNSFQQFYQSTVLDKEVDPNELYKLETILNEMQIYTPQEVELFANIFYASEEKANDLAKLSSFIKPAQDRFWNKTVEEQDQFRTVLNNFIRMYSFVTQIVRLFDKELQKLYVYAKFLVKCLRRDEDESINLNNKVLLEYYKIVKITDGSITLDNEDGKVEAPKGGTGTTEKKKEPLSIIIDKFNERFGTNFQGQDKLLLQVMDDLKSDEILVKAGEDRDKTKFKALYNGSFEDAILERYEQNDQFFKEVLQDKDKFDFMKKSLFVKLYNDLKMDREVRG